MLTSEISAEMLLEYLYPGMEKEWRVNAAGSFYRNYQPDVKDLDSRTGEITLARNGFVQLLPSTFISPRNELLSRGAKQQAEVVKERKQRLQEAFKPFDTFSFRKRLDIERQTSALLEQKLSFILRTFFGVDMDALESPLVRKAAALLPYVRTYRGDLRIIRDMISSITGYEVVQDLSHRYSERESFIAWLPEVRFEILVPGLTPLQYAEKVAEIGPFADFIREWFMPYDVYTDIVIRDPDRGKRLGEGAMLDYNGKLK